jgi:hypothetical protein
LSVKVLITAILTTMFILTLYAEARGCSAQELWAAREMRLPLWAMLAPVALHCAMRVTFWLAGLGSNRSQRMDSLAD